MTIAALYVSDDSIYYGYPDVDCWPRSRDARGYDGPAPVVAHPPCARWSRFYFGSPQSPNRALLGQDDGCFSAAITAVRRFGGVLEHPHRSKAWPHFGLRSPSFYGGWERADEWGFTCCVEQGHYGFWARKPTWLYAVGTALPELRWGKSSPGELVSNLSRLQRIYTPEPFADLLLTLARSVASSENSYRTTS